MLGQTWCSGRDVDRLGDRILMAQVKPHSPKEAPGVGCWQSAHSQSVDPNG